MSTHPRHLTVAWLTALSCGVALGNADTRALDFDFSPLALETPKHNRIERPTVTWEVHAKPLARCSELRRDGDEQRTYSSACVVWNASQNRCHLVTLPRATHVQLGHLIVACMRRAP